MASWMYGNQHQHISCWFFCCFMFLLVLPEETRKIATKVKKTRTKSLSYSYILNKANVGKIAKATNMLAWGEGGSYIAHLVSSNLLLEKYLGLFIIIFK